VSEALKFHNSEDELLNSKNEYASIHLSRMRKRDRQTVLNQWKQEDTESNPLTRQEKKKKNFVSKFFPNCENSLKEDLT
jgi:hypothetical protein